ncbi:MAG TPA: cupin domain-containing protein [Thermomicrobiales bacterium]|nr:cupin domain-containing protein [Thermomicrobiales bacterium]
MFAVHLWNDVEPVEVFPGIFRQALVTEESTIVRYTYHPGCVFPVHQHPEEQVTLVHSGEIEFEVDGAPLTLRAGQIAVIPGRMPHGARVTAGEIVVTDNFIASARRSPLSFDTHISDR